MRICEATGPALVLGSAQPDTDVDRARAAAAGVDVVRRRSGGGAVLVEPGRLVWVEVTVPAGDPLWTDDVGHAFWWLGDAWARAIGDAEVHRGALVRTDWSSRVCFAGLGPGEVRVGGRKVVGLAQRRSREGALFHCAALLEWDAGRLLDLLALDDAERAAARTELAGAAAGVGIGSEALVDRLLIALP